MPVKEALPSAIDRRNMWFLLPIALVGAVVVGIIARLWMYFARPPLWGDEVMLHMNLLGRGYPELATPLDYGQMAPVLFLWLQKTAIFIFGTGEQVVRIVPLLCGILTSASSLPPLRNARRGHPPEFVPPRSPACLQR